MRKRISDKTKRNYKKRINSVIKDLGRPIEVFKQPAKYECFNCYYDKLTDTSTNECKWTIQEATQKQQEYINAGGIGLRYKYFSRGRCPVCKGQGYLETVRKVWIDCKITWAPDANSDLTYTAAGVEGSTIIELKVDPKYFEVFKNCSSIRVDGIECKLSKLPTLRGLGNKSLMIVTAFTTEKPRIDREEQLKDY
jgi:hypothetical protein